MTLEQVAAVMLRIFGITWFVEVFVVATLLPGEILALLTTQTSYLSPQRELALVTMLLRIFVYLMLGVVFVFFSRPLAKLMVKGIKHDLSAVPGE